MSTPSSARPVTITDPATTGADPAVQIASRVEDVVVGEEIVRHSLSARLMHWSVSFLFVACLLTGMPIWTPVFGWMAHLFGGLHVCRWLHPWLGVGFFVATLVMVSSWWRRMLIERSERGWFGPRAIRYMRYEESDEDVGKYNGGQKIFFWAAGLGAVALLASGIVMWLPTRFQEWARETSYLLHDVTFIFFAVAVVGHIYLGTAAEPGTFRSMTRGTVTKPWARLHHPRWYREVTRGESRPK
jgi:formate dehydrogenase subunit gamma